MPAVIGIALVVLLAILLLGSGSRESTNVPSYFGLGDTRDCVVRGCFD